MNNIEQTLSIIKPDAVERNLDNEIKEIFKKNGFKIVKEKKIKIEKSEAEQFYKVHETKPFYNDLCNYLSSGPVLVMVLKKNNAIGQSSYTSQNLAFSSKDNNAVNQSLRRVRSGGSVAPKKKGYYR